MWTVRTRTSTLALTDPVNYTTLKLVERYNIPDLLSITGWREELEPLLTAGGGCQVNDETGTERFSGWATDIKQLGNGRAELMFTGDLVLLNDRLCWPDPVHAWNAQTAQTKTYTGSAEDQILALVGDNGGPSAYNVGAADSGALGGAGFAFYDSLIPHDRTLIPQALGRDPLNGDWYMTQSNGQKQGKTADDLTITHFVGSTRKNSMFIKDGGHGDQIIVEHVKTTVYIRFRYKGLSGSHANSGRWVRLPFIPGKRWTDKEVKKHVHSGPKTTRPARRAWFQGEVSYDGVFYRLYGGAYNNSGPIYVNMQPFIEVISGNAIIRTIDASSLGRSGGLPIGGRLEPQSLTIMQIAGAPYLVVGFSNYSKGNYLLNLYTYPLKFSSVPLDDRRIDRLRLPASAHRGTSPDTIVKGEADDVLGKVVAPVAEVGNLRVNIRSHYDDDYTPWLDLVIDDAPDLTEWARFGTGVSGGPAILSDDWYHRISAPTGNVVLCAAGDDKTDRRRIVGQNYESQQAWSRRIETFLDQRGKTDDTEIANGITAALASADETTEASAPIALDDIGIGDQVPIGSLVEAVLDGLYVIERIRQVTTEFADNRAKPKVTPLIGSPDAALSPSARQIRGLQAKAAQTRRY